MDRIPGLGTAPRCMVLAERLRIYFSKHPNMQFAAKVISTCGFFVGAWKAAMASGRFIAEKFHLKDVFGVKVVAVGLGLLGAYFGRRITAPLLLESPFPTKEPFEWLFSKEGGQASQEQVLTAIEVLGGPNAFVGKMRVELWHCEHEPLNQERPSFYEQYFKFIETLVEKLKLPLGSESFPCLADDQIKKMLLSKFSKDLMECNALPMIQEMAKVFTSQRICYLEQDRVITAQEAQKLRGVFTSRYCVWVEGEIQGSEDEILSPMVEHVLNEIMRLTEELAQELECSANKILIPCG